jgi:hypothetical protein
MLKFLEKFLFRLSEYKIENVCIIYIIKKSKTLKICINCYFVMTLNYLKQIFQKPCFLEKKLVFIFKRITLYNILC